MNLREINALKKIVFQYKRLRQVITERQVMESESMSGRGDVARLLSSSDTEQNENICLDRDTAAKL